MSRWTVHLPTSHPKHPRWCNRCKKKADTSMVSYLVRERTPARVVNRIGEFDSSRQSYKLEREVIPEEPELRWGALLTACFPCKLFFISKKDRDDPDRGGLGSLGDAIREMWGSRLVKVFDYIEEDPNDS